MVRIGKPILSTSFPDDQNSKNKVINQNTLLPNHVINKNLVVVKGNFSEDLGHLDFKKLHAGMSAKMIEKLRAQNRIGLLERSEDSVEFKFHQEFQEKFHLMKSKGKIKQIHLKDEFGNIESLLPQQAVFLTLSHQEAKELNNAVNQLINLILYARAQNANKDDDKENKDKQTPREQETHFHKNPLNQLMVDKKQTAQSKYLSYYVKLDNDKHENLLEEQAKKAKGTKKFKEQKIEKAAKERATMIETKEKAKKERDLDYEI